MHVRHVLLIFVLLPLLGAFHTPATHAQAPRSEGCEFINNPSYDDYLLFVSLPLLPYYAGETITLSANPPDPAEGVFYLREGLTILASASYPGTIVYTFADDTAPIGLNWQFQSLEVAVTWTVSCEAPAPPVEEEEDVVDVLLPGCDLAIPIPADAVVGAFVADAPTAYAPGMATGVTIEADNTAWVLGTDASGAYYKIVWVCQYLWVPVSSMGPNYDAVWNGTPLPAGVVE